MANLIVVCGPQAVGKMTVAESLRDKLRYNMMMNHDSIELADRVFGFATPAMKELNGSIREKVFSLAVKHNVDMIFTYVCAFDDPREWEYLENLRDQFERSGGQFYLAELLKTAEKYRLNSGEGETWFENHLKIDNTNLLPDEVADRVISAWNLTANEKEEREYRFGV